MLSLLEIPVFTLTWNSNHINVLRLYSAQLSPLILRRIQHSDKKRSAPKLDSVDSTNISCMTKGKLLKLPCFSFIIYKMEMLSRISVRIQWISACKVLLTVSGTSNHSINIIHYYNLYYNIHSSCTTLNNCRLIIHKNPRL